MLPFTKGMPVVQVISFTEKYILYFFLIVITQYFAYVAASRAEKRVMKDMLKGDWVGQFLFSIVLAYAAANWGGVNALGILINVFPNEPYENKVKVIDSKENGDRHKSQEILFAKSYSAEHATLEISNIMFHYRDKPRIKSKDILTLKGKKNLFGTYIDEIYVQPKNLTNSPFTLNVNLGRYIFILPALFIFLLIFLSYKLSEKLKST